MNKMYKSSALLLAIAVATCPAQEVGKATKKLSKQAPIAWYKKPSTQKIASAVIVTAALAYALAVRMDKVASPVALFTALFCSQVAKTTVAKDDVVDGSKNEGQQQENNGQTQENVLLQQNQNDFVAVNELENTSKMENQNVQQHANDAEGDEVDGITAGNKQSEENLANWFKSLISRVNLGSFFPENIDLDGTEKAFSQLI